jgi:hypothetical protein
MTFLKETGWVKKLLDKPKQKISAIRKQNMTPETRVETTALEKSPSKAILKQAYDKIHIHKWNLSKTVSVLCVVTAVVWTGNAYVSANVAQVVHVSVDGEEVGTVKDKSVVEQFVAAKSNELASSGSDIRVIVKTPEVRFKDEKAFMPQTNEQEVLNRLSASITSQPVGVALIVDGKPLGVLKDQAAANQILEQIKTSAVEKKKEPGKVQALSAAPVAQAGEAELQKVEFVQKVELKEIPIQPQDVVNPEELRKKLETGDVQPTKYTVLKSMDSG